MSKPIGIIHGAFGRAVLLRLDHSMVRHAHRDCHVIFKVGGPNILFGVKQEEHALTDEQVLLVNAWEQHHYNHLHSDEAVTLLTFYFNPSWLRELDRRFLLSGHPKFFNHPLFSISERLKKLRDETVGCLVDYAIPNSNYLNELMAEIFLEITNATNPPDSFNPAGLHGEIAYDSRIRHAIGKVIEQEGTNICLEELAHSVDLSRAQFFRLFGRSTGLAPATFVNMVRMESCLRSLSNLEIPIQDIAEKMGYFPAGNFTRFFIGQQGLSPSNYRKAISVIS